MSSSALLSLGQRAMGAAYAQLQTTSNNISNANVKGYSRQEAQLETVAGQSSGQGFIGKGVNVSTVTRAHDDFLTREALNASSLSALDAARLDQLNQLENVFKTGDAGLGSAAGKLLNDFADVVSTPKDPSARQVVLSQAEEVASRFRDAGAQIDELQAGVANDVTASVAAVNQLAKNLSEVNQKISALRGVDHAPNDLLDQRDQIVSRIGQYLQVSTVAADDGTVGVFIAGGQQLVLGTTVTTLKAVPDAYDRSKVHLGIAGGSNGANSLTLPDDAITGGSIGGLLKFQATDLNDARNLVGRLAASFSASVNKQQSLGLDLSQPAQPGAAMFSVGAPRALPALNNAKDSAGNAVGSISLAITDATALQASDYRFENDPAGTPGSYLVTRLSDGQQTTVVDGDVVDGMKINISAVPAAGDSFLLQPVATAATRMQRVLDDPKGIAAASPVVATLGTANKGTASIASLGAVDAAVLDPSQTAAISFTSDTGDYTWELRDSASNAVLSTGTGTWTPGSPITLNGFALQLNGAPRNGDTVSVSKTPDASVNNGNALAYVGLGTAAMVGTASITDAYADAMTTIGVRVQSAKTSADISSATASQTETARANQSGVNLDEEAARLIQYQQSYQAAAKILQAAQNVFDTLLRMTGG